MKSASARKLTENFDRDGGDNYYLLWQSVIFLEKWKGSRARGNIPIKCRSSAVLRVIAFAHRIALIYIQHSTSPYRSCKRKSWTQ